jgi:DNA-binding response OmpR family regulator
MRHVLVVEDDEAERKAVCELVSGEGHRRHHRGLGRRGDQGARGRRFDCIVLDLKLGAKGSAPPGSRCSRSSRATSATARRR